MMSCRSRNQITSLSILYICRLLVIQIPHRSQKSKSRPSVWRQCLFRGPSALWSVYINLWLDTHRMDWTEVVLEMCWTWRCTEGTEKTPTTRCSPEEWMTHKGDRSQSDRAANRRLSNLISTALVPTVCSRQRHTDWHNVSITNFTQRKHSAFQLQNFTEASTRENDWIKWTRQHQQSADCYK